MSMPNTVGLANRSTSERVRPKLASKASTLSLSRLSVTAVAGGVKLLPLKRSLVTPSKAETACVSGVTPRDAAVPPPTPGTTDSSTLPAGKGTAVPVRSS